MIDDLLAAFGLLTILPVGDRAGASASQPGKMFSYFPLVGLVIGAVVGMVAAIRVLPGDVTAFLALAVWVALTGGLHLDGLADACDGLLSTTSPPRRLEIMADPRAGSWAVVGVALLLLGKWIALRAIPPALLLIPPMAGRWAMVLAAAAFPSAKGSGMAARVRAGLGRSQVIAASATTLVIIAALGLIAGWRLMALLAVPLLAVWACGGWAARRLGGGLTGDVYGALCEGVELLCVLGLTLM